MKLYCKILLILLALLLCSVSERADAAASGKIRIGVGTFASKTNDVNDQQAGVITDTFINVLNGSKKITVIERERLEEIGKEVRFGQSGLVDPSTAVELGKQLGLQYMIIGSVTQLQKKASGGAMAIGGLSFGQADETAMVKIDMRIIDVATSEIRLAQSETGEAKSSAQTMGFGGFQSVEASFGGIEGRAIINAAQRLAHKVRENVADEHSYVISTEGSEFIIDEGESMGTEKGALYLVYAEGAQITNREGKVVGVRKTPLAILKVSKTDTDYSVCSVAPPTKGSAIQVGDMVTPILPSEAKGVKSPESRPAKRAYDDTFDKLMNKGGSGGQDNANQPAAPAAPSEPAPAAGGAPDAEPAIEPVAPARTTPPSAPQAQGGGSYEWREVQGVDPNNTTDAKLIDIYPLESKERNDIGIQHRGAYNIYTQKKYKDAFEIFTRLADAYPCNYLSAYWAGMCAQKLNSPKEAAKWFDRALSINPGYQPAADAKDNLSDEPASNSKKKKKK
jgi:curli biogenesis system outer membrane secretion channel CsgG/TolA-binding protein